MTLRVRRGLPSLRQTRIVQEIERTFAESCERGTFRLVHYSLQDDHAHLLVEARDRDALGRGMKTLAGRLARAVNRALGRRGSVLAERYHLHVLRTAREVRNALAYVLLNARKHGRRLASGFIDPASSGRSFDGWRGRSALPVGKPTCVARARTWLLDVGWRRLGLVDPDRIPGGRRSGARAPG